jgi:hypothetical protein
MILYDIYGKEIKDGDFIIPGPNMIFSKLCHCTIKNNEVYLTDLLNSVPVKVLKEDMKEIRPNEYVIVLMLFLKQEDWKKLADRLLQKVESTEFQNIIDTVGGIPQEIINKWTING